MLVCNLIYPKLYIISKPDKTSLKKLTFALINIELYLKMKNHFEETF